MISTVRPSSASQIVRIGRPATFIAVSFLQNPPGDRVEPRDERRIAVVGGGDQRGFERVIATLPAWAGLLGEQRHHSLDEGAGAFGIGVEYRQDHVDRHVVMAGMPAIVVRHHRYCRVTNLGFSRRLPTADSDMMSVTPQRFSASMFARNGIAVGGSKWPRPWRGKNTTGWPSSLPKQNSSEPRPNGLSTRRHSTSVRPSMR